MSSRRVARPRVLAKPRGRSSTCRRWSPTSISALGRNRWSRLSERVGVSLTLTGHRRYPTVSQECRYPAKRSWRRWPSARPMTWSAQWRCGIRPISVIHDTCRVAPAAGSWCRRCDSTGTARNRSHTRRQPQLGAIAVSHTNCWPDDPSFSSLVGCRRRRDLPVESALTADIGLLLVRLTLGAFVAAHGVQKLTHFWGGTGLAGSVAEFEG